MEKLSMCRICLVDNIRMYVVENKDLQETYEKLTNTPVSRQLKMKKYKSFSFLRK